MKNLFFNIFLALAIVLLSSCKDNKKSSAELGVNKLSGQKLDSIANLLEIVYVDDQHLRQGYQNIEKEFGRDSKQIKEFWDEQSKLDSINLEKVTAIIEHFGWLGADEIGQDANSALFLVIQHSDLNTQMKYLPILKKATESGKASTIDYALLKDRVLIRQGEKQIYGTQLSWDSEMKEYYVASMIEPEKINDRRASVGLGTIQEYIEYWNLEWDLKKYKKRIERIENKKK
ncbi:MAG: hypothetical protein ED556_08735 [Winogradskyella sp.]|uniref:DUF6624 domain-containing protein n=1 Tax=Winogradskyella sp. TaxID=1883156 RepID=UPI000F3DBD4B|nr:DUF6624 domain-containing protein [Winogradskyella sp.]RNC86369.1 MAG: hypothetical protein ED556_08735 [Winogradskyella sp.]